jgi:rod shape-determining protein MreC
MQNFAEFFRKYSKIMLFLLLLGISFYFLYRNNQYQKVLIFNAANRVAGSFYGVYADVGDYLYLRRNNRLLAEENAALRAQLLADKYKIYNKWINSDTTYKQVYRYIPAKVINNSVDKANNYVTLNIGRIHGVKPDMGIISPEGVVGVVKSVSDYFTVGISLLHRKTQLSARLRGSEFFGSLQWQGTDENTLMLEYIPSYAKIAPGDTVETTTYSSIFPEGLPIGIVKSFEVDSDEGYFRIKVKPSTEFRRLNSVYVVDFTPKNEQENLENEAKKGDEE